MKQLRNSILVLIAALTFFFNIERIDYHNSDLINVSTFAYALAAVALVCSVLFRRLWRLNSLPLILFWQAIYLVMNLLLLKRGFAGNLIYVYVTEVAFLSLLVFLVQRVTRPLVDFEEAVETFTFAGLDRPHAALMESMDEIRKQMSLCRRHDRPLSVIVVKQKEPALEVLRNQAVLQVQQAMMGRYAAHRVLRALDQQLRRTDLFVQNGDGRFLIVCPETSGESLQTLVERIRFAVRDQLGVSVVCGSASFPDVALTFDELLAKAEASVKDDNTSIVISEPQTQPSATSQMKIVAERGVR